MSYLPGVGGGNNSLEMILMRTHGAMDDASKISNDFRDAMEAMQAMHMEHLKILSGILQVVMKVIGMFSG